MQWLNPALAPPGPPPLLLPLFGSAAAKAAKDSISKRGSDLMAKLVMAFPHFGFPYVKVAGSFRPGVQAKSGFVGSLVCWLGLGKNRCWFLFFLFFLLVRLFQAGGIGGGGGSADRIKSRQTWALCGHTFFLGSCLCSVYCDVTLFSATFLGELSTFVL